MDGLTIFHNPGSYSLRTGSFAAPHLCWVRLALRSYPIDDGWRIWQDGDESELKRRVKEAAERGEITDTK